MTGWLVGWMDGCLPMRKCVYFTCVFYIHCVAFSLALCNIFRFRGQKNLVKCVNDGSWPIFFFFPFSLSHSLHTEISSFIDKNFMTHISYFYYTHQYICSFLFWLKFFFVVNCFVIHWHNICAGDPSTFCTHKTKSLMKCIVICFVFFKFITFYKS